MNIDGLPLSEYLPQVYRSAVTAAEDFEQALPSLALGLDESAMSEYSKFVAIHQAVLDFLRWDAIAAAYLEPPVEASELDALNGDLMDAFFDVCHSMRQTIASQEGFGSSGYYIDEVVNRIGTALKRLGRDRVKYSPNRVEGYEQALRATRTRILDVIVDSNVEKSRTLVDQIAQATESVANSAETAQQAAGSAQQAAGVTADATMATHFKSHGSEEAKTASQFRMTTLGTMVLGGILAALFLVGPSFGWSAFDIQTNDYVHLAQRALLLAGVFGLAGYLGRQAHNHRMQANWARSLAVQLQTFDAYIEPIQDSETKERLRTRFAARVFGDQPSLKGEAAVPSSDDVIQKAADFISKIMPGDKS